MDAIILSLDVCVAVAASVTQYAVKTSGGSHRSDIGALHDGQKSQEETERLLVPASSESMLGRGFKVCRS